MNFTIFYIGLNREQVQQFTFSFIKKEHITNLPKMIFFYLIKLPVCLAMCKLKHEEMLITYVIMFMKKLRAFDRPSAISCNTSAKLEHECKLQLARASFQNSVNLDPL